MIYNTVTKKWSWRVDGINIVADSEQELIDKIHDFKMKCNSRYRHKFLNNTDAILTTGSKPF